MSFPRKRESRKIHKSVNFKMPGRRTADFAAVRRIDMTKRAKQWQIPIIELR